MCCVVCLVFTRARFGFRRYHAALSHVETRLLKSLNKTHAEKKVTKTTRGVRHHRAKTLTNTLYILCSFFPFDDNGEIIILLIT